MTSRRRSGFTLVELLMSMTIGVVVLTAATNFSMSSWKTRRGWTIRESVDRNARFVGMSIARDAQEAGVAIESTPTFGTIGSFGDTLSLISIPYTNVEAPVYPIYNDGDTLPNYPPGGNCGTTCIEFNQIGNTYMLQPGDLARVQIGSTRRLVYLTNVSASSGGRFRVNFRPMQRLMGRPAGLDSVLLTRSGTTIQKIKAVLYWREASSNTLMRADQFNSSAQPIGRPIATGTAEFRTSILFVGNREAAGYSGADADTLNDGNDIIGLRVRSRMVTEKTDPAVNNGQPIYRWYDWRMAPRNLMYEKNR